MADIDLTDKDIRILSILAKKPNIQKRDKKKFYGELKGPALQIARAITGDNPRPTRAIRDVVNIFMENR